MRSRVSLVCFICIPAVMDKLYIIFLNCDCIFQDKPQVAAVSTKENAKLTRKWKDFLWWK